MSLTREHRQEDLSLAYILAVAAKAGYDCSSFSRHDYGIDIQLSCVEQIDHKRVPCGPILHLPPYSFYIVCQVTRVNGYLFMNAVQP
jgi:hypothetical protein